MNSCRVAYFCPFAGVNSCYGLVHLCMNRCAILVTPWMILVANLITFTTTCKIFFMTKVNSHTCLFPFILIWWEELISIFKDTANTLLYRAGSESDSICWLYYRIYLMPFQFPISLNLRFAHSYTLEMFTLGNSSPRTIHYFSTCAQMATIIAQIAAAPRSKLFSSFHLGTWVNMTFTGFQFRAWARLE